MVFRLFLITIPLFASELLYPDPEPTKPTIGGDLTQDNITITLQTLMAKVATVEKHLQLLEEQIKVNRLELENLQNNQQASISPMMVKNNTKAPHPAISWEDYQRGLILLSAKSYSEAIFYFTNFISQQKEHIFAGNAYYYIGKAYFEEKEYTKAFHSFQKVLEAYPACPLVSETLLAYADTCELLNNLPESVKVKNLLLTTFPASPSAKKLMEQNNKKPIPSVEFKGSDPIR